MNRPTRLLTIVAATAAIGAPSALLLAPNAYAAVTRFAYADGAGSPAGCPATTPSTSGCSLTAALAAAGDGDTIALATPGAAMSYVGGWSVNQNVTLQPASGVSQPILDGSGSGRILSIGAGFTVSISGVTLQNGAPPGLSGGGAILMSTGVVNLTNSVVVDNAAFGGGGIENSGGTLNVTNSTFTGNSAVGGGAIDNSGTALIQSSSFGASGIAGPNTATVGGAVFNSGTLTVQDSTFTDNSASDGGGAIANNGSPSTPNVTVTRSTFDANTSGDDGGAILNGDGSSGALTVSKSTFSGNAANGTGQGGAIYNHEASGYTVTAVVSQSTFANDSAAGGGPALAVGTISVGSVTIEGDLFAEACLPAPTWTDNGYNAATTSDTSNGESCLVPDTSTDVLDDAVGNLGPLANNGGPTQTIMPAGDNPAIGMIPNPTSGLCPRTDQRGFASSGACTAGAVEPNGIAPGGGGGGGPAPEEVTVVSSENPSGSGDPVTFTATLSPTPTCGTVSWLIDNSTPPSGTPTGGSGATRTLGPISSLSVGVHPVTAVFSGCASFGAGSGTDNQVVNTPSTSPSPTPTPTSPSTGGVTNPKIVAHVSSRHGLHHGWYRSPVHITFTCTPGSAPLTGPCPGPITLRHDGKHTVTRTITATDGGSASVSVIVNLDRTKPTVTVHGVTNGHTYQQQPTLTCHAEDGLSGGARCSIVQRHHHVKGTDDVVYHYVVTATDSAGNTRTVRGSYTVS